MTREKLIEILKESFSKDDEIKIRVNNSEGDLLEFAHIVNKGQLGFLTGEMVVQFDYPLRDAVELFMRRELSSYLS